MNIEDRLGTLSHRDDQLGNNKHRDDIELGARK